MSKARTAVFITLRTREGIAESFEKSLHDPGIERANNLQRTQEIQHILHLGAEQLNRRTTPLAYELPQLLRPAVRGVSLDGLQQVRGSSIMQEEQTLAKAPERSRTELVRTGCSLVGPVRQA